MSAYLVIGGDFVGMFEHFPYTNFQDLNLDMLLGKMKETLENMRELQAYVGGFDNRIKTLEYYVNRMENGNFTDAFLNSLYKWLEHNVPDILSHSVAQVWFGLTDAGYFVAYMPESWEDIKFHTTEYDIYTELETEYGHLVLSA